MTKLSLLGNGLIFGPYPVPTPYNQYTYVALLEETVFPDIRGVIGERRWHRAVWQQVPIHLSQPFIYYGSCRTAPLCTRMM